MIRRSVSASRCGNRTGMCLLMLLGAGTTVGADMDHDWNIPKIAELREEFREPEGFSWGHFINTEGAKIRYGWISSDDAVRAVAIVAPGRASPIEKYFELIRKLQSRGFAVWTMDWRGQGGSDRYLPNPQKSHSSGFEHDIADLHQFLSTIVNGESKPRFAVAGSMGAHIMLRYLHDHPETFDFAILVSPLFDIDTGKWPRWVARLLAWLGTALGFGDHYIPGGRDWMPDAGRLREARASSSDPDRFSVAYTYLRERSELRVGDPTYRWLEVAFQSIATVNEPGYLTAISTPVLMVSAMDDRTVVPEAQLRAYEILPNCEFVPVRDARHDLYMERAEYRDKLYGALEEYVSNLLVRMR
ncbi:alpha/beta hydrolase [Acidobacteria bacterium AH-259-A15]|nr:alpha/beta hydrolase [Acidobacteria bacterium AH-259-A15]